MLKNLKQIYEAIPAGFTKYFPVIPDSILFGRSFRQAKPDLSTQSLNERLANVIAYASRFTRFGQEHYPKNFDPKDASLILRDLPFITSQMLKESPADFISTEYNDLNSYVTTTGGTGRSPTEIRLSNESYGLEWAHMLDIWKRAGYRRKQSAKLTLRGKSLPDGRLVQYNPLYNEFVVDTFKLSASNFQQIRQTVDENNIAFIHGYPSLLQEFTDYADLHDWRIQLKGVFLGSEAASSELRKRLEERFSCSIVTWYGQSEKVILAGDFSNTGSYSVYTSYGAPYIDAPTGQVGEICGTTFVNKALPLVKYRTGDQGRLVEQTDGLFLTDVRGRWGKDFVYANAEKRIPTSAINLHSDIQCEILFYQLHQSRFQELLIKVLPKSNSTLSSPEIENAIKKEFQEKLKDWAICVEIVESSEQIVRSKRGKLVMLVQRVFEQTNSKIPHQLY